MSNSSSGWVMSPEHEPLSAQEEGTVPRCCAAP